MVVRGGGLKEKGSELKSIDEIRWKFVETMNVFAFVKERVIYNDTTI